MQGSHHFHVFGHQFDHVVIVSYMVFVSFLIIFSSVFMILTFYILVFSCFISFLLIFIISSLLSHGFVTFHHFLINVQHFDGFFSLHCSLSYFIMFVVCFSRLCFSEKKWEKCVVASSVSSFLVLTTIPELYNFFLKFSPESKISFLCHFDFIYNMFLFKNVNLV